MSIYKEGDHVTVRSDLTPSEKNEWPSFVPEMEKLMGHTYTISEVAGDTLFLRSSCMEPNAPLPSNWSFRDSWLLPYGISEVDEYIDDEALLSII